MSRMCELLIDCTIDDSMDISNILATLPSGTMVRSVLLSLDSYHTIYRIENTKFKDVPSGTMLPKVNVTTDGHTYWVDIDHLPMESSMTLSLPSGMAIASNLKSNYKYDQTDWLDSMRYDIASSTGVPEGSLGSCNHSWTMYHGLINHYEYCEHCGDKK